MRNTKRAKCLDTFVRRSPILQVSALLAIVALVVAACGSSSSSSATSSGKSPAAQSVTIAVPVVSVAAPILVAQQKGFFRENHLNVTVKKLVDITQVPDALLGGQFDISISTATNLIIAKAARLNLVAVAGNTVNTDTVPPSVEVVVRAESGITSLKGLAGKRVAAASIDGNVNLALEYKLHELGVKDVQYVTIGYANMFDQLNAGRVDAVTPGNPFLAKFSGPEYRKLGDPFEFLPTPNLSSIWISSQKWASSHKQALADYRAAMAEALKYIPDHKAEVNQLLTKLTGLSAAVEAKSPLPIFKLDITSADFEPWLKAMNVASDNKYKDVQLSDLVATS